MAWVGDISLGVWQYLDGHIFQLRKAHGSFKWVSQAHNVFWKKKYQLQHGKLKRQETKAIMKIGWVMYYMNAFISFIIYMNKDPSSWSNCITHY